jgi:hypothetical protein
MPNFIREAGWPIFPVLILGALSLVQSVRFALGGRRELVGDVVGLLVATVAMGALGTFLGLQTACEGLRDVPIDEKWLWLIGLKEALYNLDVALVFVVVAALLVTASARRRLGRIDELGGVRAVT